MLSIWTTVSAITIAGIILTHVLTRPKKNIVKAAKPNTTVNTAATLMKTQPSCIPGRENFDMQLDYFLPEAKAAGKPLSIVIFDIDYFEYFADYLGFLGAEKILKKAEDIIYRETENLGTIYSLGADIFALILPGFTYAEAYKTARTIQEAVKDYSLPSELQLPQKYLSLSFGTASFPSSGQNVSVLLKSADRELHRSKKSRSVKTGRYLWLLQSLKNISGESEKFIEQARTVLILTDFMDKFTCLHAECVTVNTRAIACALGLPREETTKIELAALLHDIGKLKLSEELLTKETPLTENEWTEVQKHSQWGAEIVTAIGGSRETAALVRHHHERFDGKGYPDNLSGEDIPLGSRIIAAADSFAAMTAHRPYRRAKSIPEALTEIQKNSGTQFDPDIVKTLMQIADELAQS